MKLLLNHIMVWLKFYCKLISDIVVNDYTTKKYWNLNIYFKTCLFYIQLICLSPNFQYKKWTSALEDRLDNACPCGAKQTAKHNAYKLYTWFKFSVTEFWRNIAKYIKLENTTLHFNWRVQSYSDGVAQFPPYVEKRKCVRTRDMQRGASSIHSNTRHIQ